MKINFSELDIQALIDNEMDWEEQKQLLFHLESDETLKKKYHSLLEQKHLIQRWWKSQ